MVRYALAAKEKRLYQNVTFLEAHSDNGVDDTRTDYLSSNINVM